MCRLRIVWERAIRIRDCFDFRLAILENTAVNGFLELMIIYDNAPGEWCFNSFFLLLLQKSEATLPSDVVVILYLYLCVIVPISLQLLMSVRHIYWSH